MMDPVLQRAMFAQQAAQSQPQQMAMPQQPIQPDPGTGITQGLTNVAETMDEVNQAIDMADDHVGIMNALRGDDMSVEERRTELASYVGSKDAKKTPESVLTLLQPTFTILDIAEKGEQGGQAEQGGLGMAMGTPNTSPASQQQAMDRMAMGEEPIRAYDGTDVNLRGPNYPSSLASSFLDKRNNSSLRKGQDRLSLFRSLSGEAGIGAPSYEDFLARRTGIIDKADYDTSDAYAMNPYIAGLQLAAAVANAPKGQLISSVLNPESIQQITDPIQEMAKAKAQSGLDYKQAMNQAELSALTAYEGAREKQDAFRRELLSKTIESLQLDPSYETFEKDGIQYFIDKNNIEAGAQRIDGLPAGKDLQTMNLGDGQFVIVDGNTGKYEILGDSTKADFELRTVSGVGLVKIDKDGESSIIAAEKPGFSTFGNADTGFYKFNKNTGESEFIPGTQKAEEEPEKIQMINNLMEAQSILRNENISSFERQENLDKVELYREQLGMNKDGEFERLLKTKTEDVYNKEFLRASSRMSEERAKEYARNQANVYKAEVINDYIDKKTTTSPAFDQYASTNAAFAPLLAGLSKSADDAVASATDLSNLAGSIYSASTTTDIETGKFGGLRLETMKAFKAILPSLQEKAKTSPAMQKFVDFLGNDQDILALEFIDKQGANFAVALADAFPGNLNQSEIDLIEKAGPSIFTSKKGLQVLAKIYEDKLDRALRRKQVILDYQESSEGSDFSRPVEQRYTELDKKLYEFDKEEKTKFVEFSEKVLIEIGESENIIKDTQPEVPFKVVLSDGSEVPSQTLTLPIISAINLMNESKTDRDFALKLLENNEVKQLFLKEDGEVDMAKVLKLYARFKGSSITDLRNEE